MVEEEVEVMRILHAMFFKRGFQGGCVICSPAPGMTVPAALLVRLGPVPTGADLIWQFGPEPL